MKKFTRILALVLVCLLAFAIFTACKKTDDDENKGPSNNTEKHTHEEPTEWEFDKENHWKECPADGEKSSLGAHNFENKVCNVCGVRIAKEIPSVTVYSAVNEYGHEIKVISFFDDGKVSEKTTEYTYDKDKYITGSKTSCDGKLVEETIWDVDEELGNYVKSNTIYNDDGTKVYTEYNSYSETTKQVEYKADGSVNSEKAYEYTYDENGECEIKKSYENGKLVEQTERILVGSDSWDGKIYHFKTTTYNEDGTTTVETVDLNGNKVEG